MITRDIYISERRRVEPISVVFGSTVPIQLEIKDYTLTGSTATAYATGENGVCKTLSCTVANNKITLNPHDDFFYPGRGQLQIKITDVLTFCLDYLCDKDLSNGKVTATVEEVTPLVTRAEEAQSKAEDAQEAAETAQGLAEAAQTAAEQAMSSKQDKLTAGDNITISNDNVISTHAPYDDTAVRGLVASVNRKVNALVKLNEGISYEWETDETEAYVKTVPSGAALATVDSVADSVTSITVLGKNLVTLEPGYIGDDGADKTTSNSAVRSGYFFVDTTKSYVGTVSHKCRVFIAYYDSQKNYIKRSGTKNLDPNGTTVTELRIIANPATDETNAIPSNAVYARITAYYNSDVPGQVRPLETDGFWVQVEEGSTITDYSPYLEHSVSVGDPFSVEPRGRIIFNQANDATEAVASTVEYAVKLSEVTANE